MTLVAAAALLTLTPVATVVSPVALQSAFAAPGECTVAPPLGSYPGLGGVITYTDNNVAVFVGGDLLVTGNAAEAEGVIIALGDAEFDKASGGSFNVGSVGAGSGITPSPGELMLGVGGSLAVGAGTVLHVGALHFPDGGDVEVGGTATPAYPDAAYDLYGGSLATGLGPAAATAPFTGFAATMTELSTDLAGRTPNGTVAFSGGETTFTGTGLAELQLFEISEAALETTTEVVFEDVLDSAPVAINVIGAGPVSWAAPNETWNGAERADEFASPDFGLLSARTLWNFVDAGDVSITGSNQLLGSVLVPAADGSLTITASTNGRVYTGGDLTMDGDGNELHNYPWFGFAAADCVVDITSGSFTLQKLLNTDESGFDGLVEIAWDCGAAGSGTVELLVGETSDPIEVALGSECSFSEPVFPDAPEDWAWGEPVIAPASFTAAIGAPTPITVTNTLVAASGGDPVDPTEELPETGAGAASRLAPLGVLLVALGGLLVLLLRRPRSGSGERAA